MSFQSFSASLCRNGFHSFSDQFCTKSLENSISQPQLDLVTSLSLQQLNQKSFQLTYAQLSFQKLSQKSFQLTPVQLCQCMAQRGASNKACNNRALRTTLQRRSLCTRSSQPALTTSPSKSPTSSLQRTLLAIFWFSLLLANFFLSNSVWKQELDKNELCKTVWAQELDKQLADKPFQDQLQQQLPENIQEKKYKKEKLELQEHNAQLAFNLACNQHHHNNNQNNPALTTELWENELDMNLVELAAWNSQLFNQNRDNINKEFSENQLATFQKNKMNNLASEQLGQKQLGQQQPASQEHLSQLCLQDPASAIDRQLPKESLSSTCLSDSSLDPAASLTDSFSFSTQKLSEQDLSDRSFDQNRFFQRNFGHRISEKQLQQNLSQDQQQLQNSNFAQITFQQLSFKQPSLSEKILNNELAQPIFQEFDQKNFYKKQLVKSSFAQIARGACKEQLLTTCFPEASVNQQLSNSSLVPQSVAKGASPRELSPAYSQRATGQKNFFKESLQKHSFQTELLPEHLCREQLAEKTFYNTSFPESSFTEETFSKTASRTAA